MNPTIRASLIDRAFALQAERHACYRALPGSWSSALNRLTPRDRERCDALSARRRELTAELVDLLVELGGEAEQRGVFLRPDDTGTGIVEWDSRDRSPWNRDVAALYRNGVRYDPRRYPRSA